MSEQPLPNPEHIGPNGGEAHGFWWKFWLVLKVLQARLRFVAILAAVGGVIVYWDTLQAYYQKWTRPIAGEAVEANPDTEYWCPMHPTVVRDQPDKCPICGMPLAPRHKGAGMPTEVLPAGVVSRVQMTPYRVALGGIRTVAVGYQPLSRDVIAVGSVEFDERRLKRISWRVSGKANRIDEQFVNFTDQPVAKGEALARVYSPDLVVTVQNLLDARRTSNTELERIALDRLRLWGIDDQQLRDIEEAGKKVTHLTIRSPIAGHVIRKYQREGDYVEEGAPLYEVADLSTVWIQAQVFEEDIPFLKTGEAVSATTTAFPNREFTGRLAFVHPHLDSSTRTLKVRFDIDNPRHELSPGMFAAVTLHTPLTALKLLAPGAGEEQQRLYRQGLVLAVPERAVIDTGDRKIVYREAEPDVFDGVEVQLGPRAGAFYPVIGGLTAGDRIATAGSFLIDAETRLTAGAGSMYFGATGGPAADRHAAATARPSTTRDEDEQVRFMLEKLSPEDRKLAEAQGYCPILPQNRLGSMGVPVKLLIRGKPVFLCCKGCVNEALADEQATLDKAGRIKEKGGTQPSPPTPEPMAKGADAKARENLAKLDPADRKLAEAQGVCPITDEPLGSMGKPDKVTLNGQVVFLCCAGCEQEAKKHPEHTLEKVNEQKLKR